MTEKVTERTGPRILIIRLSSIGDCIMASPLAQVLRENFPDAYIAWAVRDKSRAIVEGNPYVDEVIPWYGGEKGLWDTLRIVRARKFDIVLELQGVARATLLMGLSGAQRRLASPDFWFLSKWMATEKVQHPKGHIYPALRYLYWAKQIGADISKYEKDHSLITPLAPTLPDDESAAAKLLQDASIGPEDLLIAVNPGCSAVNRTWPVERFARAAQILAEKYPKARFALLGGPQDVEAATTIASQLPAGRSVVAAGKLPLRASAALTRRCAILITNDTGPMHMAVGVKTPVIGIFGPVHSHRRLPPGQGHIGVEHNETCRWPTPPRCVKSRGACACLEAVSPEEVAAAAIQSLQHRDENSPSP